MKKTGKILSAFLAVVLMFALAVPAFADTATGQSWQNYAAEYMDISFSEDAVEAGELTWPDGEHYWWVVVVPEGTVISFDPDRLNEYFGYWIDPVEETTTGTWVPFDSATITIEYGTLLSISQVPADFYDMYDDSEDVNSATIHRYTFTDKATADYMQAAGSIFFDDLTFSYYTDTDDDDTPTQPSTPTQGSTYTVKAGDNLSKIAKAVYGDATKWKVIYEANKGILKNASTIYVGQVLTIPDIDAPTQPTEPTQPSTTTYTVKAGDNLSKIAKAVYGDATKWKVIYEANKGILKNANTIYVGQVLTIPAK